MSQLSLPRDRRNVTILFADIVDSTSLIENSDAESALGLFAPAIKIIVDEVERASGRVSKLMGDGVMAVFGVPLTLEDHAFRACHAALVIQNAIAGYSQELRQKHGQALQVRIGLNSGSVVLSVSGEGEHEIYDVAGSPVHLAARIESKTPPAGIGLSNHTHQLVSGAFECEKLGSFDLKGFSGEEVIYRLVRAKDPHAKESTLHAAMTPTPMVGRGAQRARLKGAAAKLREGRGGLVVLKGEAGSGKSRFLYECRKDISEGALWLEGRSSAYDQRVSYWPFIEILTAWFGFSEGDEAQNWNLLVARLQDLFAGEAEELIPYIAMLMGMTVREPFALRVKFLDTDMLSRQILRSVRRSFRRLSARQPVILVVDDFHWADDSSVGLVEHLFTLCTEARILIFVTSRSDGSQVTRILEAALDCDGLETTEIELPPLPVEQSVELLEHLIGTDPQTRYLRDQIIYKAGGNPLFIEEVVRSMKASGVLVPHGRDRELWSVVGKEVSVPDTIQDVVMARVDRLDARLKHLLSVASVIGQNFLYVVLRSVAQHVDSVDGLLDELKRRQFIEEAAELPELIYKFRHALMQKVIYESLLLEQRKKLHEQVADRLLELFADRTQGVASVLAFHYARADQPDKALRYLLEAADESIRIAADAEALKYYEDALSTYGTGNAMPWEPWQKATIERRLAEVHLHRGNLDMSEVHFGRALEACGHPLPATRIGLMAALMNQALIQIWHRLRRERRQRSGVEVTRQDEAHLRIYESFSWLMLFVDQEKMAYAVQKGFNLAEDLEWCEGIAKSASAYGAVLDILTLSRFARLYHLRAIASAEASGNLSSHALAMTLFGLHDAYNGRWDAALASFRRAEDLATKSGDLMGWLACSVYKAMVLTERGAFSDVMTLGQDLMKQGREAAFDIAIRSGFVVQGKIMWRMGAVSEALPLLEEALRRAIASGDIIHITDAWGELGLCLCEAGNIEGAAKQLAKAELLMRERKVRTSSAVPIFLGLAQVEIARLESNSPNCNAKTALRRCRNAVAFGRKFYFGLSRALRMAGTLHWLLGNQRNADRFWQESISAAANVGAQYELALTRIEIGRRKCITEEALRGEELLARCRASS